jgi:hypothetical protein
MVDLILSLEESFEFYTELAQENINKAKDSIVLYSDRKKYAYYKNKAANYLIQAEKINQKLEDVTIINLN